MPLIQLFFALLVIFFFLAGWTGMRKRTIVSRGSFEGALTTARVIQQVGRRDLDLHRHDHGHQRRAWRADGADPVGAGHGFAGDVGRHRRGAELYSLSGPDRLGAAAVRSAG